MGIVRIPLTQGKVALIDEADAPLVEAYSWHAFKIRRVWYAAAHIDGKRQYLHRLLLGNPAGDVDHANADGLDNRRANLRVAPRRGFNIANARFERNSTGYRGVSLHARGGTKRFQATIKFEGRRRSLGYYATAEEAGRAYDEGARRLFGEFARPNFPEEGAA